MFLPVIPKIAYKYGDVYRWVKQSMKVWMANKGKSVDAGADYHSHMNGSLFLRWFREFVKYIPRGSVIVMDNAGNK